MYEKLNRDLFPTKSSADYEQQQKKWKEHIQQVSEVNASETAKIEEISHKIADQIAEEAKKTELDVKWIHFTMQFYWKGHHLDYAGGSRTETDFFTFMGEDDDSEDMLEPKKKQKKVRADTESD